MITTIDNDFPPIANNDFFTGLEDKTDTIYVLRNDFDDHEIDSTTVDLDIYTDGIQKVYKTDNVHWSVVNDSLVKFTPEANWFGNQSLYYSVKDIDNYTSNNALISVTINPVNDLPVATDDQAATTNKNSIEIDVIQNDFDVDGNLDVNSIEITKPAENGLAEYDPQSGNIIYTPDIVFQGTDIFQYEICDFSGACDVATVKITVTASNYAPITAEDYATLSEDEKDFIISPLTNDNDPDGNLNYESCNYSGSIFKQA